MNKCFFNKNKFDLKNNNLINIFFKKI